MKQEMNLAKILPIEVIDIDDTPPKFNNPRTATIEENETKVLITLDVSDDTPPYYL